jgi:tellurite resistance protein TerC
VLVFIGVKMLIEFFHIKIPIGISLGVIVLCLGGAILYSLHRAKNMPVAEVDVENGQD